MSALCYDIVIPTIRRPSLDLLLTSLERSLGPKPNRIIVVEDEAPWSGGDSKLRLAPIDGSLGRFSRRRRLCQRELV